MKALLIVLLFAPAAFAQVALPVLVDGVHVSAGRQRTMLTHDGAAWIVAGREGLGVALMRSGPEGIQRAGAWQPGDVHGSGPIGAALGFVFYEVAQVDGMRLWRTGGVLVDQLPSYALYFTEFGGNVFYFAQDGLVQCRLRRSNGEAGNAHNVAVMPGRVGGLCRVGDRLLFLVCSDAGVGVYVSDGTLTGTSLLLQAPGVVGPLEPVFMGVQQGLAWFRVVDEFGTSLVYRSDGTAAGTFIVVIDSPPLSSSVALDGQVFLGGNFGLVQTDGTQQGTAGVPGGRQVPGAAVLDGWLYFCTDNFTEIALWRTDGRGAERVWRRPHPGYSLAVLCAHRDKLLLVNTSGFGLWWHQPGTPAVSEMRVHFEGSQGSMFWALAGAHDDHLLITDELDRVWRLEPDEPRPGGSACSAGPGTSWPLAALVLPWLVRRGQKARAQGR